MKNNDMPNNLPSEELLLVENLDKNEYDVTASVIEPPIEKVESKQKRATVFGALLSAISVRKSDSTYASVRPIRTLTFLILLLIFTILLYFFCQIADIKVVLGLIVVLGACAVPIILIVFYYELCPQKSISLFHLLVSFLFGIVLYLTIDSIANTFLVKNIYKSTIDTVVIPILWGIGEFVFMAIFSKMYDLSDLSKVMLLAVTVGMGYATVLALQSLINSLFIPVELILGSSVEHYVGTAIVDNLTFTFKQIFDSMPNLILNAFYYPVCIACWSTPIGLITVAPASNSSIGKKEKNFAVYLLLVLVIVLYMLSNFTTSYTYFDLFIKLISLSISFIISLHVTNDTLNKALNSK